MIKSKKILAYLVVIQMLTPRENLVTEFTLKNNKIIIMFIYLDIFIIQHLECFKNTKDYNLVILEILASH